MAAVLGFGKAGGPKGWMPPAPMPFENDSDDGGLLPPPEDSQILSRDFGHHPTPQMFSRQSRDEHPLPSPPASARNPSTTVSRELPAPPPVETTPSREKFSREQPAASPRSQSSRESRESRKSGQSRLHSNPTAKRHMVSMVSVGSIPDESFQGLAENEFDRVHVGHRPATTTESQQGPVGNESDPVHSGHRLVSTELQQGLVGNESDPLNVGQRQSPATATDSQQEHNSGDAAGGTPRTDLQREMKPVTIGRGAEHGAGVGLLSVEASRLPVEAPPDATFLGVEKTMIQLVHGDAVVVHDGFGGRLSLQSCNENTFEVKLSDDGQVHWDFQGRSKAMWPPSTTNWIVAVLNGDHVAWSCYFRTYGLPSGCSFLGHETTLLKSSGTVVVWDGSGSEKSISPGEDKSFPIKLDAQGFFRWRCGTTEERTRAPSNTKWLRAVSPRNGQEITWRYYDAGSAASTDDENLPSNLPSKAQGLAKLKKLWRPNDKPVQDARGDEEEEWTAHQEGRHCVTCADFPFCSIHCPCTFALVVLTMIFACLGLLWPGIEIETDLDSFLEADSRANEVRVALTDAWETKGNNRRLSDKSDRGMETAHAPRRGLESVGNATAVRSALDHRFSGTSHRGVETAHSPQRNLESAGNPAAAYWNLDPSILHKITKLELLYTSRGTNTLLSMKVLTEIKAFEAKLRAGKLWRKLCLEIANPDFKELCDPGASAVNVLWPDNMDKQADFHLQESVHYTLSGAGREPLPMDAMLELVDSLNLRSAFFPKQYNKQCEAGSCLHADEVHELRTIFEFDLVCCSVTDTMAYRKSQLKKIDEVYDEFIAEELYPLLTAQAKDRWASFNINWTGAGLNSFEVWDTLMRDSLLACGSISFIFLYLTFHTKSPFVGAGSLFLSVLSIPTAFITSARLSGGNRVTGASFLSLFLIVGLGADVVLVFVNFFALSKERFEQRDYANRVLFVYRHAGMACLATSLTTAASFFANLASVLKPLREFGFFMGLCIMDVYFLVLVGLPPLMIANEKVEGLWSRRAVDDDAPAFSLQALCCCKSREGSLVDSYFNRVLVHFRRRLLTLCTIIPIVMLAWTFSVAQVQGETPAMFPDDHNQAAVKTIQSKFAVIDEIWVEPSFYVCNMGRTGPSHVQSYSKQLCSLHWCQLGLVGPLVTHGATAANGSDCTCKPTMLEHKDRVCYTYNDQTGLKKSALVGATVRFVGVSVDDIAQDFWSSETWKSYLRTITSQANGIELTYGEILSDSSTLADLHAIVQEHWESGLINVAPYTLAPHARIEVTADAPASPLFGDKGYCAANIVCYCGAPACKFRDEAPTAPGIPESMWTKLKIPPKAPAQVGGRRLQREQPLAQSGGIVEEHTKPMASLRNQKLISDMGSVSSSGPLLAGLGRRLAAGSDIIDVSVVWGLIVRTGTPLLGQASGTSWSFDDNFRPESPRTQRHMYAACIDLAEDPELLIKSRICWIAEFRRWLLGQNQLWPARASQFQTLLRRFVQTGLLSSGIAIADYMWFDDWSHLRATYVSFDAAMSYAKTPSEVALKYMAEWDRVTEDLNDQGPMDASNCFHSSRLWIRAEAEKAIVDSTIATLLVSIGCGFLGTLCFTHFDMTLSGFVVLSVTGVTTCLGFFMCVMMQWSFGAVEVLGLIVFVGYSITYSLHIAHKYGEHVKSTDGMHSIHTRRHKAVHHALKQMSSAVTGSAITTLGSSFFLFFCTMAIFVKLAAVLFAVTFFAGVFALVVLPSALLVLGPVGTCGCGAISAYMEHEPFGYDVEEPDGHAPSGVQESGTSGSFVASCGSLTQNHSDDCDAMAPRKSEVFKSAQPSGMASPVIRSLTTTGHAPGPSTINRLSLGPGPTARSLGHAPMPPIRSSDSPSSRMTSASTLAAQGLRAE